MHRYDIQVRAAKYFNNSQLWQIQQLRFLLQLNFTQKLAGNFLFIYLNSIQYLYIDMVQHTDKTSRKKPK